MHMPSHTVVIGTKVHMQEDNPPSCVLYLSGTKMPKHKKLPNIPIALPNYSPYEYSETLPAFREQDRLSEDEAHSLICSNLYEPEWRLNEFTDHTLDEHLYSLNCKRGLEMPELICKLVIFFVKRYKNLIIP